MSDMMDDIRTKRVYRALSDVMDSKPSLLDQLSELLAINCAMMMLLASDHDLTPIEVLDIFDTKYQKIRTGLREAVDAKH